MGLAKCLHLTALQTMLASSPNECSRSRLFLPGLALNELLWLVWYQSCTVVHILLSNKGLTIGRPAGTPCKVVVSWFLYAIPLVHHRYVLTIGRPAGTPCKVVVSWFLYAIPLVHHRCGIVRFPPFTACYCGCVSN